MENSSIPKASWKNQVRPFVFFPEHFSYISQLHAHSSAGWHLVLSCHIQREHDELCHLLREWGHYASNSDSRAAQTAAPDLKAVGAR